MYSSKRSRSLPAGRFRLRYATLRMTIFFCWLIAKITGAEIIKQLDAQKNPQTHNFRIFNPHSMETIFRFRKKRITFW